MSQVQAQNQVLGRSWRAYDKPAMAQLAKRLTVERDSYQMVPGSIPGGRIADVGGRARRFLCVGRSVLHLPFSFAYRVQTYLQTYSEIPEKRAGV